MKFLWYVDMFFAIFKLYEIYENINAEQKSL